MSPRNVFKTKTVAGGLLSLATVVLLTVANGASGMAQRRLPAYEQDIKDLVALLNNLGALAGLSGFGVTVMGRLQATGDVFTPHWLPGRNEEQCALPDFSADSTEISAVSQPLQKDG